MPSKSPAQANLMRAVAHNPRFAKKVGIPMGVGKDYVAADKRSGRYASGSGNSSGVAQVKKRLSGLKQKYAKGGPVKEAMSRLKKAIGSAKEEALDPNPEKPYKDPKSSARIVQALKDQGFDSLAAETSGALRNVSPKQIWSDFEDHDPDFVSPARAAGMKAFEKINSKTKIRTSPGSVDDEDSGNLNRLEKQTTKPKFAEGGKVGAIRGITRLMEKYGGDSPRGPRGPSGPMRPAAPLYVDRYGTKYSSPADLVEGVKNAIFEESDEPNWGDALGMLQKIPGSEPVQKLVASAKAAHEAGTMEEPDYEKFSHTLSEVLDSLAKAQAPVAKAKGGVIHTLVNWKDQLSPETRRIVDQIDKTYRGEERRKEPRRAPDDIDVSDVLSRKGTYVVKPEDKARGGRVRKYDKGGAVKQAMSRLKKAIGSGTESKLKSEYVSRAKRQLSNQDDPNGQAYQSNEDKAAKVVDKLRNFGVPDEEIDDLYREAGGDFGS